MKLRQRFLPFLLLTLFSPLAAFADRAADERACGEGPAMYKVLTLQWDSTCGKFAEQGTCATVCLYTDNPVPNPLPAGRTEEMYFKNYPIEHAGVYRMEVVVGPLTDDVYPGNTAVEKCDSHPCQGSWYKVRTADYDIGCLDINSGYNDNVSCESKYLFPGNPPSSLPPGKTAEDYVGSYPITVIGEDIIELAGGPYAATCSQTAQQVCAAAKIEGCDFAWGCSWDTVNDLPRHWYKIKHWDWYHGEYHTVSDCSGTGFWHVINVVCASAFEATNCYLINPFQSGRGEVLDGPHNRECDIP